jgi:hypothetical protein
VSIVINVDTDALADFFLHVERNFKLNEIEQFMTSGQIVSNVALLSQQGMLNIGAEPTYLRHSLVHIELEFNCLIHVEHEHARLFEPVWGKEEKTFTYIEHIVSGCKICTFLNFCKKRKLRSINRC